MEAQRQKPSPSKKQETWGLGGICYLKSMYMREWAERAQSQTRAEAGDAEMKDSGEQEWVVRPTLY